MEIHELYIKSNYADLVKSAEEYKRLTAQETASAKISIENAKQVTDYEKAKNKIKIADNSSANKIIELNNKASLDKDIINFKAALKEKQALQKSQITEAAKFHGQSDTLPAFGSLNQLTSERKSIITQLSSGMSSGGNALGAKDIAEMTSRLEELNPQIKEMADDFKNAGIEISKTTSIGSGPWKELLRNIKQAKADVIEFGAGTKSAADKTKTYGQVLQELSERKKIVSQQTKLTSEQLLSLSRDLVVVSVGVQNVVRNFQDFTEKLHSGKASTEELSMSVLMLTTDVVALAPAIQAVGKAIQVFAEGNPIILAFTVAIAGVIIVVRNLQTALAGTNDTVNALGRTFRWLSGQISFDEAVKEFEGLQQAIDFTTVSINGMVDALNYAKGLKNALDVGLTKEQYDLRVKDDQEEQKNYDEKKKREQDRHNDAMQEVFDLHTIDGLKKKISDETEKRDKYTDKRNKSGIDELNKQIKADEKEYDKLTNKKVSTGHKTGTDKTDPADITLDFIKLQVDIGKERNKLSEEQLNTFLETIKAGRDKLLIDYESAKLDKDKLRIGKDLLSYTQEVKSLNQDILDIQLRMNAERSGSSKLTRPGDAYNFSSEHPSLLSRAGLKGGADNFDPKEQAAKLAAIWKDGISSASTLVGGLKNAMSIFNIGIDTGVGKMISGLDIMIQIIQAGQSIASGISGVLGFFASIIPGGGALSAVAHAAGGMSHSPNHMPSFPDLNIYRAAMPAGGNNTMQVHNHIYNTVTWRNALKIETSLQNAKELS